MIKLYSSTVTFTEFPDEVALCLSISNCPNHCKGCSSSYLAEDTGEVLTVELLNKLLKQYSGITLVGFMGGDNDHTAVLELTKYIHDTTDLLVGMYSGRDFLDLSLAVELDYYKIGRWIPFTGPVDSWKDQTAGPLCLPTSNQIMYKRVGSELHDITYKFRKYKINNWQSVII